MKRVEKNEIITYLRTIKPELEAAGIDRIGLFGSVAKDQDDLLSDIDIMIHTTPKFIEQFSGVKGFLYLDELKRSIARKFGRKVDLCDEAGLKKKMESVIYA